MGATPKSLRELEVLILDAQTSGATPLKGHLIEVGWAAAVAGAPHRNPPVTHLLCLPEGEALPPAVSKLTGLRPEDMAAAGDPREVWRRLSETAAGISTRTGAPCTAVIHYARFERPFLERWHAECVPDTLFPFEIICTHALARRLLPGLPRCGLRALAGYFGADPGPLKRCAGHVAATERIWGRLVGMLAEAGVQDPASLGQWLRSASPPAKPARTYPMPVERYRGIPDRPGVYRFRRSGGELLYVGKAKSLRQRIGSYFQGRRRHPEHILEMLTQAADLDYSETATALEAALQEAEEIRRRAPRYNIRLQARDQAPLFSSRDFQQTGPAAEAGLTLGPFPSRDALLPLAALTRCLAHDGRPPHLEAAGIFEALGRPSGHHPPVALFMEGLDLFRQCHGVSRGLPETARRLLQLGARWWRRQREERQGTEADAETKGTGKTDWTRENVLAFMEGVVCRGAFWVRRGRWFSLLSEATLAWEYPRTSRRVATLKIGRGRIGKEAPPACIDGLPPPEGHDRTLVQRKAYIDAAAYARLRVLTTELKRLLSEGRRVRLRPKPSLVLDEDALGRLLFWV